MMSISPLSRVKFWALLEGMGREKAPYLKSLSQVTAPTSGKVKVKGRIASLLEVGTGFHPELTGRENIYLNGAILGMKRKEIDRKFDEIVAFAEVEKFIDTPVKRYSSGMYVRLAFAVAAHLEPEILLVDEVLSVGDVQFQKKSLGKMSEVAQKGRTILFVSHNMGAISSFCNKGIVLQEGKVLYNGDVIKAINSYTTNSSKQELQEWIGDEGDDNIRLLKTWVRSLDPVGNFHTAAEIEIGIMVKIIKPIDGLILGFTLFSSFEYELAYILYDDGKTTPSETIFPGDYIHHFRIPPKTLAEGTYRIEFDVGIHMLKRIILREGSLEFNLINISDHAKRFISPKTRGYVSLFRPEEFIE